MIEKRERQQDILRVIEKLDISPSMYKNADEKYHALAEYLSNHVDVSLDMYAQGSFAFGTVVRPFKEEKDGAYDLDFICEVDYEKNDITPEKLRDLIECAIDDGELYGGKMVSSEECLTIQYAEESGTSFSIDIVPAVRENDLVIGRLMGKTQRPDLVNTAIAISMRDEEKYIWRTNNPKGLTKWFRETNDPYKAYVQSDFRKKFFERTKFYSKIEDIPEEMERSSVQRVIQILKRHRDIYYHKRTNIKPISAIINVVVTTIAARLNLSTDIFSLLEAVLEEINDISKIYSDSNNSEILLKDRVIARRDNKWYIANPANPEDNLADGWNDSEDISKTFFKWVSVVKNDFVDSMDKKDEEFKAIIESALGQDVIKSTWGNKYDSQIATPISTFTKPWKNKWTKELENC